MMNLTNFHSRFPGYWLPAPDGDSVDMERPEWLNQMETVVEALNDGVVIADDHHTIHFGRNDCMCSGTNRISVPRRKG